MKEGPPASSLAVRLASWSGAFSLDQAPEIARHAAKRCLVDTLGVMLLGARHLAVGRLRSMAEASFAEGPATVLGAGGLSPSGAALVNGMAAHVYDFDDTSYTGIMHGSALVLPAALALAEDQDASGEDLLAAFLSGLEISYALALAMGRGPFMRGWWSSHLFGLPGAAAAGGKLMGLDKVAQTSALGLAAVSAGASKAAFGSDGKPLLAGRGAQAAVEAVQFAAAGLSGPTRAYEDERGYFALFSDEPPRLEEIDVLGRVWRVCEPGIFFKRYPLCSAAHAAAELSEGLLADVGVAAEAVESVICRVPPLVAVSMIYGLPESPIEAQFSLPFALGCQMARRDVRPEHLAMKVITAPDLQAAMTKVTVVVDESLAEGEAAFRHPECAALEIQLFDGRRLEGFLGEPSGMPGNPMSDEILSEKFRRCAAAAGLPEAARESLLEALWSCEAVTSVSRMMKPLGDLALD